MPLIGFVNDEGERLSFEETWKRESFGGLPVEVLYRIYLTQSAESRPDGLTVTSLLGCARKAYLQRTEPYYGNPRFLYALFRGTLIHEMLEGTNSLWDPKRIISEVRFHREIPGTGIVLSGKIDKYLVQEQRLDDYKTIKDKKVPELEKAIPEDYVRQANIYRWILDGNGYPVKSIKIIFVSFDFVYTTGEVCLIEPKWTKPRWARLPTVPMLRMSAIEDLLVHRAKDIVRNTLPPPVEASNRWQCIGCPFKSHCWPEEL